MKRTLLERIEILEKQQRSTLDIISPIWDDYNQTGGYHKAIRTLYLAVVILVLLIIAIFVILQIKGIC